MSNIELKAGFIEYNVNFITYDSNGFITSNCNSIAFINYGTNSAKIESVILQQNQSLTIDGKKMPFIIQFDVNDNPTKMGIKMQFVLTDEPQDPRDKQELANKISVALQKRLGDAGITVAYDDRNAYRNVIGFTIPLTSISQMIMKAFKGSGE